MSEKKRLFSGIQPTGNLHLGNYLGAVRNWISLQDDYEAVFCIVDLHAITVAQDPCVLRQSILDVARVYLAAGIDPDRSTIFVQSDVGAHAELCWVLNTVARMGDMEKMTQFKDKSDKEGSERSSVGLFDYPVLMAADILLYDTEVVPVGDDQRQHVELTRTLARRFNKQFGETFVVPRADIRSDGMRIMGLDDPTKKMSKSAASEYNYISLTDTSDIVRKKIMKAVTDSEPSISYDQNRPGVKNLIDIYSLLDGKSADEIVRQYDGKGFGDFKKGLAHVVVDFLLPLQDRMAAISDDDVCTILERGAQRAGAIASEKYSHVKKRMGLGNDNNLNK